MAATVAGMEEAMAEETEVNVAGHRRLPEDRRSH